jgi:hypothetical protein
MPPVLMTDDQIYTNDISQTRAPAVRLVGSRIRFTNEMLMIDRRVFQTP